MRRYALFYLASLIVLGGGVLALLWAGKNLPQSATPAAPPAVAIANTHPVAGTEHKARESHDPATATVVSSLLSFWLDNLKQPLSLILVQILVILLAARGLGVVFKRFGQPQVIGEMIAGILLGPSLFGALAPAGFGLLFPASSLGALKLLSSIGVLLFMFAVGMELDLSHIRKKASAAVLVSHISILFPYFLGVLAALLLYHNFAPGGVPFQSFALFMGIAMSITAFPVLARIIRERGLTGTFLGSTAITCAAVDDVTAWCLLAIVIAVASSGGVGGSILTVLFSAVFVLAMVFGVKPALNRLMRSQPEDHPSNSAIAVVLVCVFTAALFTEMIGIHALFGAFLAGVIVPDRGLFRTQLRHSVESVTTVLLLPLFFAFTGLRTQIGLLNDPTDWGVCLLVIALATLGKLGGTFFTARLTGMGWLDSFRLGALMNTRGLIELIVLNIGYEAGILSPIMFTIMVLMALTTTILTGPLLTLADRIETWRVRRVGVAAIP